MKRSDAPSIGLFTIGVAALFLVGFLLLVIFGASTYRNTVGSQTGNNNTRATLAYFASVAGANDAKGSVSVQNTDEGQMLVVGDGSGYALHIFCRDQALWEDYGPENKAPDMKEAQLIGPTSVFQIEEKKDGLYQITTDEGTSLVYFRSEGSSRP